MNLKRIHFIVIISTITVAFFSCKKDAVITIGGITGPSTVCYGDSNIVYSITLNPGADYVLWTVPEQAQITLGQGTNTIAVHFGRKSGNVCATFFNNGRAASNASCLAVNFDVSNRWCREIDFKGGARDEAVGFSIGNKGYIGTGFNGPRKNDLWEFDPALNTWTQKADFGGLARSAAVGFSIGNKGYIGTGYNGATIFKDFWQYDPLLNQWFKKADCSDTARNFAFGFSIGNKGYIGSGNKFLGTAQLLYDFYEYDPATDQWTRKADIVKRLGAVGFSIGNKGYVGTGNSETNVCYKDFREFDTADSSDGFDINHHPIGKWTQKADLPGPARTLAVGFSIANKGYISVGYNYSIFFQDFWEYDPLSNSWIQKPDFGGGKCSYAVGFSIENKGYLGTGSVNATLLNNFWVYAQ